MPLAKRHTRAIIGDMITQAHGGSLAQVQCRFMALMIALCSISLHPVPGAERKEATPDTRLFSQEIPVGRSLFHHSRKEAFKELFTTSPDGTKKRMIDLRDWFFAQGVHLPKEGSAIYDWEAQVLFLTAGLSDLDAAFRTIALVHDFESQPMVRTKIALVRALKSIAADGEPANIDNFDQFKALAAGKLVTVASLTGIGRSGNRLQVTHDSAAPNHSPDDPGQAKQKANPDGQWPPPPGIERMWFESESVICPDGLSVDSSLHVRYASPARGDDPLVAIDYHTSWTAPAGLTRIAKTFNAKPKDEPNRLFVYALLVTFDIIEPDGSVRQKRE